MRKILGQQKKMQSMHRHILQLHKELKELKAEISYLKTSRISIDHHEAELSPQLTSSPNEETTARAPKQLEENTTSPLSKNSTPHKKSTQETILQEVQNQQRSLKELKHIIVDQKKLCSKASFYRYIKELREQNIISQLTINSTEFIAGKLTQ